MQQVIIFWPGFKDNRELIHTTLSEILKLPYTSRRQGHILERMQRLLDTGGSTSVQSMDALPSAATPLESITLLDEEALRLFPGKAW
jgi:hypothetical protein